MTKLSIPLTNLHGFGCLFLLIVAPSFWSARRTLAFSRVASMRIPPSRCQSTLTATSNDNDVDPILQIPLLQAELAQLKVQTSSSNTSDEQKERMAALQEALDQAVTTAELGVRTANLKFYEAFSSSDYDAMEAVWSGGGGSVGADAASNDNDIQCVHPGMPRLQGRAAVLLSWLKIFQANGSKDETNSDDNQGQFSITAQETHVNLCGGTIALVTCREVVAGAEGPPLEAMNVYRREDGAWKMIVHMASPVIVNVGGL